MSGGWQRGVVRSCRNGGDSATVRVITTRAITTCVIKVGGSLLGRADWPRLLAELVQQKSVDSHCLLVVGGGPLVDGLRAIDAAAPQPPDIVHRLAIDLMGATARMVAAALAVPLVAGPTSQAISVLDVPEWLGRAGRYDQLPVGWHVTSDSIAAFVAARSAETSGCELLLAKSVPPPVCPAKQALLESLAQSGWIDAYFPEAAATLTEISWACPHFSAPATPDAEEAVGGTRRRRR